MQEIPQPQRGEIFGFRLSFFSLLRLLRETSPSFVLNEKLQAVYEAWLKENPYDAGAGWAGEPWFQKEMPLTKELVERRCRLPDRPAIHTALPPADNAPPTSCL